MNTYTPDNWVILRMTSPNETNYKILAGFYGGFAGSDSWKLSSGVCQAVITEEYYAFPQYSGSSYICYKGSEKLSSITASMLSAWQSMALVESLGTVEMISVEEFLDEWYK